MRAAAARESDGMARQIIEGLGLQIATPDDARKILALKGRENVAF